MAGHHGQSGKSASFTITVPAFACSFPLKSHPEAGKVKELSEAWVVERFKNMPAACKGEVAATDFSPATLLNSAFHLLATLYYADATSAELLLPIAKLMCWYFMLDNFLDDPSEMGADLAPAKRLVESLVAVFAISEASPAGDDQHEVRKPTAIKCGEGDNRQVDKVEQCLMDSAREWWEEMRLHMTPSQQARFSALFIEYLRSNCEQVPFREDLCLPNLHTYLHIRKLTAGVHPLNVLNEYCLGMELDHQALTHPLLVSLHDAVCDHSLLVNDIMSFAKEYAQGDICNLVFILCFDKLLLNQPSRKLQLDVDAGCSNWQALLSPEMLQEGVMEVSEMLKEADSRCVGLMKEIRASPLLMGKPGMEAYLQSLAHITPGNLYWHRVTVRYNPTSPSAPGKYIDTHQPLDLHLAPFHLHLSCPAPVPYNKTT